jgi:hypothetical protein
LQTKKVTTDLGKCSLAFGASPAIRLYRLYRPVRIAMQPRVNDPPEAN